MDVYLPRTLAEALEVKAAHPDALPIAGGTDVMVEINFDRRRPASILDLTRAAELQTWRQDDGTITLGAGVPYTRIVRELTMCRPLVEASRTVGGNLGTASPAGDALPVLAAYDADVILAKAGSVVRSVPWHRFLVGPKKTTLAPDELIVGARWKVLHGPGSFSKVGTRNAMVIAIASLCLAVDEAAQTVRVALGSVGPTILRAPEAEQFATRAWREAGVWADPRAPVADGVIDEFGERVAAATES